MKVRKDLISSEWIGQLFIHAVVAAVILAALFMTVHSRSLDSNKFNRHFVKTNIFQDRWNGLSDFWSENGLLSHGGLWNLWSDKLVVERASKDKLRHWGLDKDFNDEVQYYYRSCSGISIIPLHIVREFYKFSTRETAGRKILVYYSQSLVALTAALFGLAATRLCRQLEIKLSHAVLLGICVQAVMQTHPLMLMSYFRLYFEHVFLLMSAVMVLSFTMKSETNQLWFRSMGIFGMTLANWPLAIFSAVSIALLGIVAPIRMLSKFRWVMYTTIACALGLCVIGLQYLIILVSQEQVAFVGSGLMFRSGLDGDTSRYISHWSGITHFLWGQGGVFYGSRSSLGGPTTVLWLAGCILLFTCFLLSSIRKEWSHIGFVTASTVCIWFPFLFIFGNALYIHPFAYPMLLLPSLIMASVSVFPSMLVSMSRNSWPIILIVLIITTGIVMLHLRQFAIVFPTS